MGHVLDECVEDTRKDIQRVLKQNMVSALHEVELQMTEMANEDYNVELDDLPHWNIRGIMLSLMGPVRMVVPQ